MTTRKMSKALIDMVIENRTKLADGRDVALLDAYAWPGGYPLYYITEANDILCPKCAAESLGSDWDDDKPVDFGPNWEDESLHCCECSELIECAYPEDKLPLSTV